MLQHKGAPFPAPLPGGALGAVGLGGQSWHTIQAHGRWRRIVAAHMSYIGSCGEYEHQRVPPKRVGFERDSSARPRLRKGRQGWNELWMGTSCGSNLGLPQPFGYQVSGERAGPRRADYMLL
jgi:hypothetical protein